MKLPSVALQMEWLTLLEKQLTVNALRSDQEETEERSTYRNTYIPIQIQQCIQDNNNWLYIKHPSLAARCFPTIYFYDGCIYAAAWWFLLDWNIRDGNGVIRIPFGMVKRNDFYRISLTDEQFFSIPKTRLSRKNEMGGNYSLQIYRNSRYGFQYIIYHIINWLGFWQIISFPEKVRVFRVSA